MSKSDGAKRAAKIRKPCPDCHRSMRPSSMARHRQSHLLPWHLVDTSGDCWEWQGSISGYGYGMYGGGTPRRYVHRRFYEAEVGPVPNGWEVDHLCRNRSCVRPSHLEAVTYQENRRRGSLGSISAQGRKTHCPRGHEYTPANTITRPSRKGRECRICNYAQSREWRARQRKVA